jgi:hypothetical protein
LCCLLPSFLWVTHAQTTTGPAAAGATANPCAPVLDDGLLKGVISHLNQPVPAPTLWNGYRPDQRHYVFTLTGPKAQRCAVVWRDGAIVDLLELTAAHQFLTPLFGFLLPAEAIGPQGGANVAEAFAQPDPLCRQLLDRGIAHSVFVPLSDLPKMPFEMGSFQLFDIAIHEAFHAFAQMPWLLGVKSAPAWISWTRQNPDRTEPAARCYGSATPTEQRLLAPEKALLVSAAHAALAGDNAQAVCRDAAAFVRERRRRWSELSASRVAASDKTRTMSCAKAETIMEAHEGVPDFVSWLTHYQLGIADRTAFVSASKPISRPVLHDGSHATHHTPSVARR